MIVTIQRLTCDLCGVEAERELPIADTGKEAWTSVSVQDSNDKRKKAVRTFCPDCTSSILEAIQTAHAPKAT